MTEQQGPPQQALITWEVPGVEGASVTLQARAGHALVLVGPNGSGKSALAYWMSANNHGAAVTRVLAQRRVWLRSSGSSVTYADRQNFTGWLSNADILPTSRIRDEYEDQRSSGLIFDLFASESDRNAKFVLSFQEGQRAEAVPESVLDKISRIFSLAGLGVTFRTQGGVTIDAWRDEGVHYPIENMSDGEKNAFLLAAQVLLSPTDSVVIIDEPERHLHRAISPRFVAALTDERPDVAFVLMTHDLDFTSQLDPERTTIAIVTRVVWTNGSPTSWGIHRTPVQRRMPEPVREAILGGRSRLLLVEGDQSSLDMPLYRVLYPDWTVIPCGSSGEVIRATKGLHATADLHWVRACGIVDRDERTPEEAVALGRSSVMVLPFNEVESVYYLPLVVDALARQQAAALGSDATEIISEYRTRALAVLDDDSIDHLAEASTKKKLHRQAQALLSEAMQEVTTRDDVQLSIPSTYAEDRQCLKDRINVEDYDAIVRGYSVKDSRLPWAIATALKFRGRPDYESAVRTRLANDTGLLQSVTSLLPTLAEPQGPPHFKTQNLEK